MCLQQRPSISERDAQGASRPQGVSSQIRKMSTCHLKAKMFTYCVPNWQNRIWILRQSSPRSEGTIIRCMSEHELQKITLLLGVRRWASGTLELLFTKPRRGWALVFLQSCCQVTAHTSSLASNFRRCWQSQTLRGSTASVTLALFLFKGGLCLGNEDARRIGTAAVPCVRPLGFLDVDWRALPPRQRGKDR